MDPKSANFCQPETKPAARVNIEFSTSVAGAFEIRELNGVKSSQEAKYYFSWTWVFFVRK